jgi:hypothetical protein
MKIIEALRLGFCGSPSAVLKLVATLVSLTLLVACESQPPEEKVTHPTSMTGVPWLRSEYKVVGREVKEYDNHSGTYVVLTFKHGVMRIRAECHLKNTTDSGEDFPSTPLLYDDHTCSDVPMGDVMLERTNWDALYYFSGNGKHRSLTVLTVKNIEIK